MRDRYAALIAPLLDQEINKTFYNTLTRRFFKHPRRGSRQIEFVALDIEPTDRIAHPVARLTYSVRRSWRNCSGACSRAIRFARPYADSRAARGASREAIAAQLGGWGSRAEVRAVEMLQTVFYRERRAYLVGRVFGEREHAPLVIALVHADGGIRADAVLTDATITWRRCSAYTRSYFLADLETVGDAVVFLRTLLPKKPVDELYTVLGRAKQGKTERYRHFYRHFGRACDERFVHADGERAW
jgi:isocitrate dehydrogenase kinase/phosphatase